MRPDQLAGQTWNKAESLADTSRRIHDGASSDAELRARANTYVSHLIFGNFPQSTPRTGADVLEIGSGVGWIMAAMDEHLTAHGSPPKRIVGLDIAPNMLDKARERLGDRPPYAFQLYDGLKTPFGDCSFDLIYSVACLQHVPRPYVFNLFFEIKRLLRQRGFAVLHFLSTDCLKLQEPVHPWRTEIDNQIRGLEGHWHHFYTEKELRDVLAITGFGHVKVKDDGAGTLVACIGRDPVEQPATHDRTESGTWFRIRSRVAKLLTP
jgi:SAM-dependent methyltransferase